MKPITIFHRLSLSILLVGAAVVSGQQASPGERPVPEIAANRIMGRTPIIDGRLTDSVWTLARTTAVRSFTQYEPTEGQPMSESTLVAVLYDDAALYVGFWCYDSEPNKILRQLVRRDRSSESDRLLLMLDPGHDHQTGNYFELTAAGVQRDGRFYNDNWSDDSWDGVWTGDVHMEPWGWTAEMRIPYYCLRFPDKEAQIWGIDFNRYISRKQENGEWAFWPSSESGEMSKTGHLAGLDGIHASNHLELLPYVVSKMESEPKSIGNPDGRDYLGNTGFDLKYGLSSDLILDATVNPDFGQVELDEPVLNLSTYETFYGERRPFFVEGANLFETNYSLFYSRRIGRPPRGSINDPNMAYYREYPEATTILGAAKLTGKLARRTTLAVLTSLTQAEKADYGAYADWVPETTFVGETATVKMTPRDTVFRQGLVEPKANYTVLRLKQDIFKNSFVGGMLTMASQDRVHPAVTGGVDWRLYTPGGKWVFSGQTVFSREDNVNTGYGLTGHLEKAGGKHIRGSVGVDLTSPELKLNRLGYLSRNNERSTYAWAQYRTTDKWWIIRNSWNNFNFWSSWNYDGINYSLGGNWNSSVELNNGWWVYSGFDVQGEKYSDLETRGNGVWVWPEYPTYAFNLGVDSDTRKKISFSTSGNYGTDRGGYHWGVYQGVTLRPRSNLQFGLSADYHQYIKATRWVRNVRDSAAADTRSIFGDLDQDYFSFSLSTSILLRRNLSVQLSGEGLISGLDYAGYRYYLGEKQYSDPLTGINTDYNYAALNSMLLVRWEYIPGSTLYLVWTRARDEVDPSLNNLVFSRDFDRLLSSGGGNVFLIKTSYWLNI
jgi:hypothetical protein